LELLPELNTKLYELFEYVPNSSKADSPIDHALAARQGVRQDFAHIMIALVRQLKIPCRYVLLVPPGQINGAVAGGRNARLGGSLPRRDGLGGV
jgi:transglutaminase-like putative cysteine protease